MTMDNLERALRAYCRRRPFRPFLIEFMSGDRLRVTHPEIVFKRGELFLYVSPGAANRVFDNDSICQMLDPEA